MIKHKDLEISSENPFSNCKLGRKKYAEVLSQIIDSYKDGFVLAINNKWGTGKTTFVNMWNQQLLKDGYKTVNFNAWENDFEDNPLTALMGEMNSLIDNKENEDDFKQVLKKGAIIAKNVLPEIVKAVIGRYIDIDELKNFAEASVKGLTEIFEEDVKDYANKKKSIGEFKLKLQYFVSNLTPEKPLIFIIDELDRCRPNYAVSVLEQIKHFFAVPGIIFILSIDKEQLGNAVKGVYGNDNIDSNEYLRRFIDLEYVIPEPDIDQYCEYLYKHFEFDDFFTSSERRQYTELHNEKDAFLKIIKILFRSNKITLRQQQKILGHARLGLKMFPENHHVFPLVYVYLIFIRTLYNSFYTQILKKQLNIDDLQNELFKTIDTKVVDKVDEKYIARLESYLVTLSFDYLSKERFNNRLVEYKNGKYEQSVKSKIEGYSDEFEMFNEHLYKTFHGEINISGLLNKIELTETIMIN